MLSCCFERDLCIVQPEDSFIIPTYLSYPKSYGCPMLESDIKFGDIYEILGLNIVTASILDDIRLITTSTLSFSIAENNTMNLTPKERSTIIQSVAQKINENLQFLSIITSDTSSSTDLIYDAIHLSAIVYTSATACRIPLSLAYPLKLRHRLCDNLRRINLSSWKKIPGIFLWVLFIACPGSGDGVQDRLLRRNASLTSVYLGFRALGLSVSCLRNLYRVQRWIADGEGEISYM
jgi:hypothetical protein